MRIFIGIFLLTAMVVSAQETKDVVIKYKENGLKNISGYLWNARTKKSEKKSIDIDVDSGFLTIKGNFGQAKSINSYMAINQKGLDIDLRKNPVLEIRIKASVVSSRKTFVWIKHYKRGKDSNYFSFYLKEPNKWETVLIRLDKKYKRNFFAKMDSFELMQNYQGRGTSSSISIDYVRFRKADPNDEYSDGEKPLFKPEVTNLRKNSYPGLYKNFRFGVWGVPGLGAGYASTNTRYFASSDEAIVRVMRSNYFNSILAPAMIYHNNEFAKRLREFKEIDDSSETTYEDVLNRDIKVCRKYSMTFAPFVQCAARTGKFNRDLFIKQFIPIVKKFKDHEEIFGWYMCDEPPTEFWKNYVEEYNLISEVSPKQVPFVNICHKDTLYAFSDISSLIMTDYYPIKTSNKFVKKNKGIRNPWAIAKWCKMVERYSKGKPHYLIISTHSFFDTAFPTVAELRLQSYLALANGADSLYYFILTYSPNWLTKYIGETLLDPYGNPSSVWAEVGQIGKKITPVGSAFICSGEDNTLKVDFSNSNPVIKTPAGEMPTIGYGVRKKNNNYFVFLWNNNLYRKSVNGVKISNLPEGYKVYNLIELLPVKTINGYINVELEKGDGAILAVCSGQEFENIAVKAWKIKTQNELIRVKIAIDQAIENQVNCDELKEKVAKLESDVKHDSCSMQKTVYQSCIELDAAVKAKLAADKEYTSINAAWEDARRNLGETSKILSKTIEAPRVIMYQYGQYPVNGLTSPGASYVKQALMLSLAFKAIDRLIEERGIKNLKEKIYFIQNLSHDFFGKCQTEFQKEKPAEFVQSKEDETKLIDTIGKKAWNYYKRWLLKGNGL
jgi:hypothetical protein